MEKLWAIFLMVFGFLCGLSCEARAQTGSSIAQVFPDAQDVPKIELRGIVNVPGHQLAMLQIGKEPWLVKTGDRFKVGRHKAFQVEVVDVDLTNEIVRARIGGELGTNSLPVSYRPANAQSWIHLQNADFRKAMNLYAILARRTFLLHPGLETSPISCEAAWAQAAPDKSEIAGCFAKPLGQREAATLEDGDSFLQILPSALLPGAAPGSKDLSAATDISQGMIDFEGVDLNQIISIYGRLVDRQRRDGDFINRNDARIYFTTACPLSKAQVIYALETLFRWNGANIVLNDDNTFSFTKSPPPVK